jgi:tetratricopeptide (TPR) repeat protein
MEKNNKSKINEAWNCFHSDEIEKAKKICKSNLSIRKYALEANYLLGLIHYDSKNLKLSLDYLQKALSLDSKSSLGGFINYWIGRVYDYSGSLFDDDNPIYDKSKAIEAYKKSKEYKDYPSDTIFRIAYTFNEFDKTTLYEEGIKKFPKEVDSYLYLGKIYKRKGYLSKQLEVLDLALSNEVESSSLLFNLGSCYFEQKEYFQSESYFRLCLDLNKNENALPLIYYSIGNCQYEQGEYEKANQFYEQGIEAGRNDNSIWHNIMGIALSYNTQNKINLLVSIIDKVPTDTKYFEYLSFDYGLMSYFDSRVMEEVRLIQDPKVLIEVFEKVRKCFKDKINNTKVGVLLAFLHEYDGNLISKLHTLRTCDSSTGGFDFIGNDIAEVYSNLLESDKFDDKICELFTLDLKNIFLKNDLIEHVLSEVVTNLFTKKKYEKIVSLLKNLSDIEIEKFNLTFKYAYSLKAINQTPYAKKYYELHLKSFPKESAGLNNLGIIYKEQGDIEKAISLYRAAIKHDPEEELYRNNLKDANQILERKLESEKQKRIPVNWGNAIKNINVTALEDFDYFNIVIKINRINQKYKNLIERDFNELSFNYLAGNYKSTIVLSGSLVELVLTYFCEKRNFKTIQVKDNTGRLINKKLYDSVLNDLISFIEDKKLFGNDFQHLGNLARVYRNFIHPGLEIKSKAIIKPKAEICFISSLEIMKKILA